MKFHALIALIHFLKNHCVFDIHDTCCGGDNDCYNWITGAPQIHNLQCKSLGEGDT